MKTVTQITNGIKVSVSTQYMPEYSNPYQQHFVFAYHVRIENIGTITVQLLRRHWFINDSLYEQREVEGEGVIGQQPILEPNQVHKYVSGCNLKSEIGKMKGSFLMENLANGNRFEIVVPEFLMVVPYRLN